MPLMPDDSQYTAFPLRALQNNDKKTFVYLSFLWFIFGFLTDFDTLIGGEVGGVEFGKLPFGACEEPVR